MLLTSNPIPPVTTFILFFLAERVRSFHLSYDCSFMIISTCTNLCSWVQITSCPVLTVDNIHFGILYTLLSLLVNHESCSNVVSEQKDKVQKYGAQTAIRSRRKYNIKNRQI